MLSCVHGEEGRALWAGAAQGKQGREDRGEGWGVGALAKEGGLYPAVVGDLGRRLSRAPRGRVAGACCKGRRSCKLGVA